MTNLALGIVLGSPVLAGAKFLPETEALVARFTTPPTALRKQQINTLINSLKVAGVWAKLDALYVMAAADSQAARRNWIADLYNLTAVSSPTFTTDRGYAGDGVGAYLESNAPWTSLGSGQNNVSIGAGTDSANAQEDASLIGVSDTLNVRLIPRSTADQATGRINNGGTTGFSNSTLAGRYVFSRVNSAGMDGYKNGAFQGNIVAASTTPTEGTLQLLRHSLSFSTKRQNWAFVGDGLNSAEIANLDGAISVYLAAVGV